MEVLTMSDSNVNQTVSKISFSKVILCVILLMSAMALTVELLPAGTQVGVTASAATQAQLKNKQAQLQSQQKSISAKLKNLKKSKLKVETPKVGQIWNFGEGLTFECLNDYDLSMKGNSINNSSICKRRYQGYRGRDRGQGSGNREQQGKIQGAHESHLHFRRHDRRS